MKVAALLVAFLLMFLGAAYPRINPADIPYTPCGQQLVDVEMVQIGGATCAQLTYRDGSMNHLCDRPPNS